MEQNELDRMVSIIAARVRERLAASRKDVCQASASECTACGNCVTRREEDVRTILSLGAARVASGLNVGQVSADLAHYIDHTLLKPDATKEQLRQLCEEAKRYSFYSVCVNSANVRYCRSLLMGSPIKVVAVVGFPLGASSTAAKVAETREAIRDGADEVDMVMNIGELKSRNYQVVYDDIRKVVEAAGGKPVKVILETGMLTRDEKVIASALAKAAGARFVKTSTGFGPGGATAEDVALMKQVVGTDVEVKASGGVRDREAALAMIQAGATRIGASASVAIVTNRKLTEGRKY